MQTLWPRKGWGKTDYPRGRAVSNRSRRRVWDSVKTGKMMSDLERNMINYMVVCVNDYADRHGLSYAETFDYLLRNKGLEFLEDCYDAEHTLSLDTALDDLEAVCKRNEGMVA